MRRTTAICAVLLLMLACDGFGRADGGQRDVHAADGDCLTFKETSKSACGEFLAYWKANGGLAQQGFPISDVFSEQSETDGKTYPVQYYERAVFELHPELPQGQRVLLSLLGVQKYKTRYNGTQPGGTPIAAAVTAVPTATVAATATTTPTPVAPLSTVPMATATGPLLGSGIAGGVAVPPTNPVATAAGPLPGSAIATTAATTVAASATVAATATGSLPQSAMGVDILQKGCANGYRTVTCGFIIRNTTAMTFGVVELAYTLYDTGGSIVATDSAYAYYVHGGERVGTTSGKARPDNVVPARVEVQVVSVKPLDGTPDYAPLTSQMASYLPNEGNPKVTGSITNMNGAITGRVDVNVILFDDAGNIVGAGSGIVNDLPDHGQRLVEVMVTGNRPARIEVFAAPYFFGV